MTLFGLIALSLNFINSDQLARALEIQEQEDREGKPHRWLGLICIEQGFLKPEHIGVILQHQSKMAA